jgi:hypothetical protein
LGIIQAIIYHVVTRTKFYSKFAIAYSTFPSDTSPEAMTLVIFVFFQCWGWKPGSYTRPVPPNGHISSKRLCKV